MEGNSDTWYNMEINLEDVMLSEIVTKGQILYNDIYMRYLEQSNT